MLPCLVNEIFRFVNFFVLKIGPDWGTFSRANIGGKDSLRHELPHTRNPGLVRATVLPGDSFWCEASKQPRDWAAGVWGTRTIHDISLELQLNQRENVAQPIHL